MSSSLIPCLFLGHRCPLHILPCQCHWRRTLPRLGAITGFQLLSCFCCVHLDVSNDTAIVELSNLLVPEEFPESLQFSSVQVSRSQTQQFWVSVIFLLREQPRGQCLSCTSVSWSCLGATVSPGAPPGPQNLLRSPMLPMFGTCRLCCGASSPATC